MLFCLHLLITRLQVCAASLLSAAAALCVLGVEVQVHTFPGDSQESLEEVCCQKMGKRCWQRQELTPEGPHRVSVCGARTFSGRPLSIQGSTVHREGLTNVCFAECSDNSAQLMVWAAKMWKLEGDSRSPLYRMGETGWERKLTSVGSWGSCTWGLWDIVWN